VLEIDGIKTCRLLTKLAGADAELVVACAFLNWLEDHMLVLIARDFVLAWKETDWGKSLLGMLLIVGSHQVLILVAVEIDLICVPLHLNCGVQVERLVLVNFGDAWNGAVLSLLLGDCLNQL
jgi:hypothetical protein